VTCGQWTRLAPDSCEPNWGEIAEGIDLPIVAITSEAATEFCQCLTEMEKRQDRLLAPG